MWECPDFFPVAATGNKDRLDSMSSLMSWSMFCRAAFRSCERLLHHRHVLQPTRTGKSPTSLRWVRLGAVRLQDLLHVQDVLQPDEEAKVLWGGSTSLTWPPPLTRRGRDPGDPVEGLATLVGISWCSGRYDVPQLILRTAASPFIASSPLRCTLHGRPIMAAALSANPPGHNLMAPPSWQDSRVALHLPAAAPRNGAGGCPRPCWGRRRAGTLWGRATQEGIRGRGSLKKSWEQ
jgi:hypothetical protein